MATPEPAAAELLEQSAAGYAAAAASRLLEADAGVAARYGAGALASWKAHFVQRLLELAAALRVGAPEAFVSRVVWQYRAFVAREANAADLRTGLASLRDALVAELPDAAARSAASYIDRGLAVLDGKVEVEPSDLDPKDPWGSLALRYIAACLEGDPRRAIDLVLSGTEQRGAVEDVYSYVIFPVLREIGRMWHSGEASVAEERVVTETTRRLMTLLTHARAAAPHVGKAVVTAAVAGNAHEVGVRAVADLFEIAGWRCVCLGADVPPGEIANAVRFFDADLVVLGVTLTTQLKSLEATVDAVRAACGDGVKILVGGSAMTEAPESWKVLGADGYASAREAVDAGGRLVGLTPTH